MRAIVPAYGATPADLLHVGSTCREAGLEPLLVLQDWRGVTDEAGWSRRWAAADFETLLAPRPLGKGGAVKHALTSLMPGPFVVVDADLHALEPRVVDHAAQAAVEGRVARPCYPTGAGRLGRRLWPVLCALEVFPVGWHLDGRLSGLEYGGLIGPVQGYPHPTHALASPRSGAGWDLDVLLRHLFAGDPLDLFEAGEREHRPGGAAHLDRNLRDLLDAAAGWVRW